MERRTVDLTRRQIVHSASVDDPAQLPRFDDCVVLVTGGSDYHGYLKPHITLGCSWVSQHTFDLLIHNSDGERDRLSHL